MLREDVDQAFLAQLDQGVAHRRLADAEGLGQLGPHQQRAGRHFQRHDGFAQGDRLRLLHLPAAGKARAVVRDHKRIVEAIAAGQPEEARERVREHLSGTLGQVEQIRAQYPDYVV